MQPFKYSRSVTVNTATQAMAANELARLLAGGTNLLDLMKEDVERPSELVDISGMKAGAVTQNQSGGLSLSAFAKNADTANDPLVRKNYPLLTQAILAGASAQIRNMASNGGNLNQRTRCPYFYEVSMPCNKREPGSGCGALEGNNRLHAIFGWSDKCVAVHPSDMCVALAALDAVVQVQDAKGQTRTIPFADYHRLPGDQPQTDNTLRHDEVILSLEVPAGPFASKSYYLKVRDRASYAFALVSVAAALETDGNTIRQSRIALGGVAHKPWRAMEAEKFLAGKTADEATFKQAAALAMQSAKPLSHNKYKVELSQRAIARALMQAMGGTNA